MEEEEKEETSELEHTHAGNKTVPVNLKILHVCPGHQSNYRLSTSLHLAAQ